MDLQHISSLISLEHLPALVAKASAVVVLAWLGSGVLRRLNLYLNLRHLPGPPMRSLFDGNFKDTLEDGRALIYNQWLEKYGRVMVNWGALATPQMLIVDNKAIGHILKNDAVGYHKPFFLQFLLERLTGHGLFIVEGEDHRKQRRAMNPAFGPAEVRGLTDVFFQKTLQLRDGWVSEIQKNDGVEARVDSLDWLTRMTLDVIGEAGFNYDFGSLSGKDTALKEAFSKIFTSGSLLSLPIALKLMIPPLRLLPETDRVVAGALATEKRIGKELLARSKAAVEKVGVSQEKDLLSLLVKSNMSKDLKDSQRLNDSEVLAQIPTFLLAGHETTSNSTTTAIFLLCTYPRVQSKLREELLSVNTDTPTMDELNNLRYLDHVSKETLRIFPPVPVTSRVAQTDDVLPLSEPFVDIYGRSHDSLSVKKGTEILIPIAAMNKDKAIWGEDAYEFNPERWENLPEAVKAIPGVYGNLMTFLGGTHACIGWRFSMIEMKVILFVLLRTFEFELDVPESDVWIRSGFPVSRPEVVGKGNQLPVKIKPVNL